MALSDVQYRAIQDLGALNGVALHCKYLDQTRKMKKALILALPKRRVLGQAFELATNDAFLEFIENEDECPGSADFTARVDRQIITLQEAFSAGKTTAE
ncbi:MAG: hypothetical protein U9Q71_08380 [Pseudomonadota bacterium]|nr:hypothetical protein [Pseudomonadota bacterium]